MTTEPLSKYVDPLSKVKFSAPNPKRWFATPRTVSTKFLLYR